MIRIDKNIRALIFDCDGTLVDSMPLHYESWRETFEAFGREYPHTFVDERKGMPINKVVEEYNREFNTSIDPEKFVTEYEIRTLVKLQKVKPIKIVTQIVYQYNGILPMAVCSGSNRKSVETSLKAIGIYNYFDEIITADDHFKAKPAPDIFLEAAKRLNVEPQFCQVFEDSDFGILAAQNAGMVATDIRKYL